MEEIIFARVELHTAKDGKEYKQLHRAMAKIGFFRFYQDKALPEGTYVCTSEMLLKVALSAVKRVVHLVHPQAEIILVRGPLLTDGLRPSLGKRALDAVRSGRTTQEKMDRILVVLQRRSNAELDRAGEMLLKPSPGWLAGEVGDVSTL